MHTRLAPPGPTGKSGTVLHGFDKLALRLERKLTKPQLAWLRKRSRNVNQRLGRPMGNQRAPHLLTITRPNRAALKMLATLPESTFVNRVEVAMEVLADSRDETRAMTCWHYRHVLHARHGKQKLRWKENGFYTAWHKRGMTICGYGDRDSKLSFGRHPASRVEVRFQGTEICSRALNVVHPRGLLNVDAKAVLQKHLRFYQLDLARLGRHHRNSVRGERRKTPAPDDWLIGAVLFRRCADRDRTIQSFVDHYGMGPWLRPVPLVALLMVDKPRRDDAAKQPCCDTTKMTRHSRANTTPTAMSRNHGNDRGIDTTGTCIDEHAQKRTNPK